DPATQRLDLRASANADAASTRYAIVQFKADALADGRRSLQALGIDFVGYVPNNAYLVRLNGSTLDEVRANPAVRAVEHQPAGLKIDPRLWTDARGHLVQQQPEDAVSGLELLDI